MVIQLTFKEACRFAPVRASSTGVDGAMELLDWLPQVCVLVDKEDCALFSIGGCGEVRWPVFVLRDLDVFLEQVPPVIGALRSSSRFSLYMCEQGLDREIVGEPQSEGLYRLTCRSYFGEWRPDPESIIMTRAELSEMFFEVALSFYRFLKDSGVVEAGLAQMWAEACGLPSGQAS